MTINTVSHTVRRNSRSPSAITKTGQQRRPESTCTHRCCYRAENCVCRTHSVATGCMQLVALRDSYTDTAHTKGAGMLYKVSHVAGSSYWRCHGHAGDCLAHSGSCMKCHKGNQATQAWAVPQRQRAPSVERTAPLVTVWHTATVA